MRDRALPTVPMPAALGRRPEQERNGSYRALDPALDWLAAYGPDLSNGFTSHAPMVVEALCALGRPEAVMPWLEAYRPALLPRPAARAPIAPDGWRALLGREERSADWMAFMQGELCGAPWRAVLARWLERLSPGYCAGALHGAIRVAHAARALGEEETAPRLRELGDALGAWAAGYQTLPTSAARRPGSLSPREAIERVPLQPLAERRFRGSIVSALEGLDGFTAFAPVIDWIECRGPDAISWLSQAFARVYLGNAHDALTTVVFVHGITAMAALRSLVPHLTASAAERLIRHAWQAGAALHASFGSAAPFVGSLDARGLEPTALVDAAIAHGDDHVIKLTEACLREYALLPDPVFLHAARHAREVLPGAPRRPHPVP